MAVNPDKFVRKSVSLPLGLAKRLDDFRFEHRFKSESEAVRALLEFAFAEMGQRSALDVDSATVVPLPGVNLSDLDQEEIAAYRFVQIAGSNIFFLKIRGAATSEEIARAEDELERAWAEYDRIRASKGRPIRNSR